jgi:D-alanyl-D-alanine carboxypeptidase/D-alanyl-D-alanine-endopeptidase (penicillin-binding protein 4)
MSLNYRRLFVSLIPLYLLTCSQSSKRPENTLSPQEFTQNLNALAQDSILQAGSLALCVQRVADRKVLIDFNAGKILNTASCQKAITTATALEILGENFAFATDIEYDGQITNGVLNGNLYIKGYGDPTLGSQIIPKLDLSVTLAVWTKKIAQAGIRKITGSVIADEEFFNADVMPSHWIWSDMGNYFGAPAMALNVMDNTFRLYFRPSKLGQSASLIRTEPAIPQIKLINEVKTAPANTGDNASIAGAPYDEVRYVTGTIPAGGLFFIKGAMPDPALWLVQHLTERLNYAGISISQKATSIRLLKLGKKGTGGNPRKLIHRHQSPTLSRIVEYTNLYSVNLYAEAILKRIGWAISKEATTQAGIKAVKDFWAKRGIRREIFWMLDGSGLSMANGITALQMTEILSKMTQEKAFNAFYASLPIAGVSGTMKGIGTNTPLQNNLRAKTGGMTRVLAYTGYYKNAKGQLHTFTLIANQFTCKSALMQKRLTELLTQVVRL